MMRSLAVVLVVFLPLVRSSCDFPPNLWCSSKAVAKQCNVLEQCMKNSQISYSAGPVNLTLYYESLCPDCREFINTQLYKTWQMLGSDVLNITLVPYGNAREEQTPFGDWKFTCQHGPEECVGNLIETCAIAVLKDFKSYFAFIYCMEKDNFSPKTAAEKCAQKLGIDYSPIQTCTNSKKGNSLEHQMAEFTDALNPPHKYVPWITMNGVHTEKMNDEATRNLLKLVCNTYKGPTPSACKGLDIFQSGKCYRN